MSALRILIAAHDTVAVVSLLQALQPLHVEVSGFGPTLPVLQKEYGSVRPLTEPAEPESWAATHDVIVLDFARLPNTQSETAESMLRSADRLRPQLARAAAAMGCVVLVDPADYRVVVEQYLRKGVPSAAVRQRLALKACARAVAYEAEVVERLSQAQTETSTSASRHPELRFRMHLRGPRLRAAPRYPDGVVYQDMRSGPTSLARAMSVGATPHTSLDELVDGNLALSVVRRCSAPAAAVVAANVLWGAAQAETLPQALELALSYVPPRSGLQYTLAVNRDVAVPSVELLLKAGLRAVVASAFDYDAMLNLHAQPELQLLAIGSDIKESEEDSCQLIDGGIACWRNESLLISEPLQDSFVPAALPRSLHTATTLAWSAGRTLRQHGALLVRATDDGSCAMVGRSDAQATMIRALELAAGQARDLANGALLTCITDEFSLELVDRSLSLGIATVFAPAAVRGLEPLLPNLRAHGCRVLLWR